MIGLISLGLAAAAGYSLHKGKSYYNDKRKSNSNTIAKLLERAIDRGNLLK